MMRFFISLLLLFSLAPAVMAETTSPNGQYWEYTFRPGDSLWSIAQKYTTSANNWKQIQRINRIRLGNDRKIQPGTRIVIPVTLLKIKPTPARVIALTGDASVQRANGERLKPEIGTLLYSGDKVITTAGQTLRLQFADESELQILGASVVVLDKLSFFKKTGMVDTRIRLDSGRVSTQVRKQNSGSHYQIITPAATTAVRGTAFRLAFADKVSRTEVTEGKVGVMIGDNIKLVPAGFGLVAEQGKPLPDPVKLLSPPLLNAPAVRTQSVRLSWQALDGAISYRYQLASDAGFSNIHIDMASDKNQVALTQLEPGHYFLRVRAIDRNQLEGKNAQGEFDVLPVTQTPHSDANITTPINTLLLTL
jgi:hypothetical protein